MKEEAPVSNYLDQSQMLLLDLTEPKNKSKMIDGSVFYSRIKDWDAVAPCFGDAGKMRARSHPVAVGTRGTIGSLIMQEIAYFNNRYDDTDEKGSSNKKVKQQRNSNSKGEFEKVKSASCYTIQGKKSKMFIASMCSKIDVAESNKYSAYSGYTYRKLKAEIKRMQI